jgi:hypothetical protein
MVSFRINEKLYFVDVADNTGIVMNVETGVYYATTNWFSTNVFENLMNGVAVEKILGELRKIKDCPGDMENRINTFVRFFMENKVFIPNFKENEKIDINREFVARDKFCLGYRRYGR